MHKFIKLRNRKIFTRSNHVRLRYVTLMAVLLGFMVSFGISPVAYSVYINADMAENFRNLNIIASLPPMNFGTATSKDEVQELLQSQMSDGMRKASEALKKAPLPLYSEVTIGSGDTLDAVLQKEGLSSMESYLAVQELGRYFNPRLIKPGQRIMIHYKRGEGDNRTFDRMVMQVDPVKEVTVAKKSETEFLASVHEEELLTRLRANKAEVQTSLYGSAARAGIPATVVANAIRVYSWNIDFQRDIQPGDKMEILYETQETKDGTIIKNGNILYASLTIGGKEIPIYRYEMADGTADYFGLDGHSIKKMLMKTPIDGARMSSGFGMRHHPILGYGKMHKGIDFAAPTGTPIYAAGNATVDFIGRKNGYGNYIALRHNSKMKTAYAHMHRFAKGLKQGQRVQQGDIIGYVGTTGRSTGPHLHYEILVDNVQVNPRGVNLPTGQQLEGSDMKKFKTAAKELDQKYASLSSGMKLASAKAEEKTDDTP